MDSNIIELNRELHPYLVVLYPQKMFKQIPLVKGSQVIGRGQEANIHLEDPLISRNHCEITFDGVHVFVKDLGSTNGTFVDGVQIEQMELKDKNRLQLGCLVLKVEFETQVGLFDLSNYEASTKDPLTGVNTFNTFDCRSFGEISLARINNLFLHLGVIKVNNLKELQTTYGDQCKDLVLKEVGRLIKEEMQNHNMLARLDDCSFVMLITKITPEDCEKYLTKICHVIQDHRFSWKDTLIPVSITLSLYSKQGKEVESLQQMLKELELKP